MSSPWLRRGVVLILLLDLALVVIGGRATLQSPVLSMEIRQGSGDDCPWVIEEGCLVTLGGVMVRAESFVSHPTALTTAQQQQHWRTDQDALRAQLLPGSTAAFVFRSADGTQGEGRAPIWARDPTPLLPLFLPVFGTGILMALIGAGVLLRGEGGPAVALFVVCQSALLCMVPEVVFVFGGPVVGAALHSIQHVAVLGALSGVMAMLYLAVTFPRRLVPEVWVRRMGIGSLILAAVVTALYFSGIPQAPALLVSPSVLAAGVFLGIGMWRPARQIHRLQGLWVLWGLLVPVLVWGILTVASVGDQTHPILEVLPLLALNAISIGISMAVLRHRLLGIQLIFRRTLVGATVFGIAAFAFHFTVAAFAGSL
ncbi:MAG: hypothetical protein ACI8RZ_007939, partial [Myxococcota bacterium]